MTSLFPSSASDKTPDFAFPLKVEADANARLADALKSHNGPATVKALVDYSLAKTSVSTDSLPTVIAKIEQVVASTDDVPTKAMLHILLADIYESIYIADPTTYLQRQPTGEAPSDDYTTWCAADFQAKIEQLTDSALALPAKTQHVPLSKYSSVVTLDNAQTRFYPTLFDFIAYRAASLLNTFDLSNGQISPKLLGETGPIDAPLASPLTKHILRIYNSLVEFHTIRDDAPALVMSLLARIGFVNQHSNREPLVDNFDIFDTYFHLYSEYAYTDASVEFLLNIPTYALNQQRKEMLYKALTDFAKARKSYFRINAVLNAINEIERKSANVSTPTLVGKDYNFKIGVKASNVNHLTILVYRLGPNQGMPYDTYYSPSKGQPGTLIDTIEVKMDGSVPFSAETVVDYKFSEYGRYVLVPQINDTPYEESYRIISCSDLSLQTTDFDTQTIGWVVNPVSGQPVDDASLRIFDWRNRTSSQTLKGHTAADGSLVISHHSSGQVQPFKGDDRFSQTCDFYAADAPEEKEKIYASLLTDLGLYHLGDTVGWSAIAYKIAEGRHSLLRDAHLRIEMVDANYRHVDSVAIVTDQWGRASGRMTLPAAGLTGNFQLRIWDGKNVVGNSWFMVSDYKLPTFQVTIDNIVPPATPGDSVSISGLVATFANFPLADADVKMTLKCSRGWFFWDHLSEEVTTLTGTTDASGHFTFVIPPETIASSPWPKGYFTASVVATSISGETHEAQRNFNLGKPLNLNLFIPDNFEAGVSRATVKAIDIDGNDKEIMLGYSIENTRNGSLNDGTCRSGDIAPLLSSLPSGPYTARFWPIDPELADSTARTNSFVAFRPTDTASPVDSLLWVAKPTIVADSAGHATIIYATTAADAYVRLLVADKYNRLIRKEWLTPTPGLHSLDIELPEGSSLVRVYLRIVKDLQQVNHIVQIESLASQRSLVITTETFRDKATPGAMETITLRTSYADGAPAKTAMMIDIPNKAIDLLRPNFFSFSPVGIYFPTMSTNGGIFRSVNLSTYSRRPSLDVPDILAPALQTYGLSFFPSRMGLFSSLSSARGPVRMMKASANMDFKSEIMEDGQVALNDAVSEEEVAATGADSGAESPQSTDAYRPSEIPLALFEPNLTTDAEGRVSVTYRVPDANTTWLLRSLAYDADLLTAGMERSFTASKAVMVSINAPRFLRTGDKVEIPAMVMNATDSTALISAKIEIIDPATSQVLSEASLSTQVAANGSYAISTALDVPFDIPMVLVRAKASTDEFTDGEQQLIPILASDQTVIESEVFYIAPDQRRFTKTLEPNQPGDQTYLQFTENPTWEVVTALPGLRQSSVKSSISAAGAIFSACVASGLARSNPEIERYLRRVLAEGTTQSKLEQDAELKTLLLNATPWMAEALSDSQRIQRLALILDRKEVEKCLAENIHILANTQTESGGWAWTANYRATPSDWATLNTLSMLGNLKQWGYLPDDKQLDKMIRKAVAYIDASVAKAFSESPNADFTQYAFVRRQFPDIKMSTAASKALNATIQRTISNWTDMTLASKAVGALILNANGYAATARQIVESLRQYATSTPEKGMWWQQLNNDLWWSMNKEGITSLILEAFAAVGAPEVDAIRQWLILQKTATDWGSFISTSQVIASLLTTGKNWAINSRGTAIRVGNRLVAESAGDKALGMSHVDISDMLQQPAALTIDRQANYPSYGSVIRTGRRTMADVEAKGCDGLNIEKALMVFDGERWVASQTPKVGDRVRVVLTLRVGRDLDYVAITDNRAAGLEPVEQLPKPIFSEGLCFYRENLDSSTTIFIDHLPVGTYVLTYDLWASQQGRYSSGVATAQSQYNPSFTAHSSGQTLTIE